MIKQSLIRYFKNLKYFFTPLGTLFLSMIFGFSLFLPITGAALKELVSDITALSQNVYLDVDALFDGIIREIAALDWSDPFGAIGKIFSNDWLKNTLTAALEGSLSEDAQTFVQQIGGFIETAAGKIATGAGIFLFCTVIGLFGGFFLTRFLIRRESVKTAFWKRFLVSLIGAIAYALFVFALVRLLSLWKPGVIITVFIAVILFEFFALCRAYFLHAVKKIPFKQVVNFKNVLSLFVGNLLIQAVALLLTAAGAWLTNELTGAVIAVSLFEIAFFVMEMNAEAYVKSLRSLPLREQNRTIADHT